MRVFATGTDPLNPALTYKVFARDYAERARAVQAAVVRRAGSARGRGTSRPRRRTNSAATTGAVNADGTLGSAVISCDRRLPQREGAVLIEGVTFAFINSSITASATHLPAARQAHRTAVVGEQTVGDKYASAVRRPTRREQSRSARGSAPVDAVGPAELRADRLEGPVARAEPLALERRRLAGQHLADVELACRGCSTRARRSRTARRRRRSRSTPRSPSTARCAGSGSRAGRSSRSRSARTRPPSAGRSRARTSPVRRPPPRTDTIPAAPLLPERRALLVGQAVGRDVVGGERERRVEVGGPRRERRARGGEDQVERQRQRRAGAPPRRPAGSARRCAGGRARRATPAGTTARRC